MNQTLHKILRKVQTVQRGTLHIHINDEKYLYQARAGADEEFLNCIVEKTEISDSLISRNVSLIQRDKQDYLHITCKVKQVTSNQAADVVSLEVLKACWFIRRFRRNISWLQQKYTYESSQVATA